MSDKKRAPKKVTIDYQNGKIYKIVNDVNDMIYVGSTTTTLSRRLSCHKVNKGTSRFYTELRAIGKEHFRIILIELFPCTCKSELEAREFAVMNEYPKDTLFNSIIDGKHADATKQKIRDFWTGKLGPDCHNFKRGSIFQDGNSFRFQWHDAGEKTGKKFTFGAKRTREEAYQACLDLQEQIYPLVNPEE